MQLVWIFNFNSIILLMYDRTELLLSPLRVDYFIDIGKYRIYNCFARTHSRYTFGNHVDAVETAQQYFYYVLQISSIVLADYVMPIPVDFNNIIPTKLINLFWTAEGLSGIALPTEIESEFGPCLTFTDDAAPPATEPGDST